MKLLTSFKKIKKLTRDWRVTAHALKRSNLVELSGDGHRVKRHAHLPDNLRRGRTMTSILAIRVPEDWATLESITNLFSTYGNITLGKCYVILCFPITLWKYNNVIDISYYVIAIEHFFDLLKLVIVIFKLIPSLIELEPVGRVLEQIICRR